MKEFITAVADTEAEDAREQKIQALIDASKGRVERDGEGEVLTYAQAEAQVAAEEGVIEFKVDDRVMRAYPPTSGQLAFMMAALGRGQANDSRLASIINLMLESLRDEDRDYMEGRLLTRDPKKRMQVEQVEAIFEYLIEEWFRPALPADGAAVHPGSGAVG